MSKLRKITRGDFNDTMNRLYVYGGPLSGYDFSNHDLRECLRTLQIKKIIRGVSAPLFLLASLVARDRILLTDNTNHLCPKHT